MNLRRIGLTCMMLALYLGLLTGCWDRNEMDELAFVMASGLDLADDGELEISLQIALPTGIQASDHSGGKKAFMAVSEKGNDGMDIFSKEQQQLSRNINLGHRRVIIIGEALGRKGINQVMDTLLRSPESRYNSYIATAYGTTAKEVIRNPYPLEKIPAVGLNNIMEGNYSISVKTDEFLDGLATYGKNPVTPGIRVIKDANGNPTFVLDKIAVYRQNQLVGFLSGEQQKAFMLYRGNTQVITWSLQFEPPKKEYKGTVNIHFLKVRTSIHTRMAEGKPAVDLRIKTSCRVSANDTELDFNQPETLALLEQKYEDELRKAVAEVITVSQQEFKSDIFGFGRKVHIDHPYVWKEIKDDWNEIYPSVPVEVKIDVKIERIGRTQAPGQLMKY
ncbi:Spore germination protein B3 precursor [compost metagenome]